MASSDSGRAKSLPVGKVDFASPPRVVPLKVVAPEQKSMVAKARLSDESISASESNLSDLTGFPVPRFDASQEDFDEEEIAESEAMDVDESPKIRLGRKFLSEFRMGRITLVDKEAALCFAPILEEYSDAMSAKFATQN